MAIRRTTIPGTPVSNDVASILLRAWGAEPPGGRGSGFGGGLVALATGQAEPAALWLEHEAYLRTLARAWGWKPAHYIAPTNEYGLRFVMSEPGELTDGPYFYAEALAIAGPQRR